MVASDGKPPPPKAAQPPSPTLDECIKPIISLGSNAAALSTRNQAALINAMVGYCIHLAKDQDAIAAFLCSGKEFPKDFAFDEMPAMKELVTDPALFQCVLSMLSPKSKSGGTIGVQNVGQANPPGSSGSYQQKHGRKRSPSDDVPHNASRKKLMLSPTPKNRLHSKQAQVLHGVPGSTGSKSNGQVSEKSIPVFAATILYSVFQHADYWPVQIVKAFAEDSFGPRNWVDDERCQALVSNLNMSLKEVDSKLDDKLVSAAEAAEKYFSSLMAQASIRKPTMPSSGKASNGATTLSSQPKSLSSKERRKQAKIAQSSDSSSGEEEVLESELIPTKNVNGNPSVSTVSSSLSLPYLFQQNSISKKPVRPRYHMHSLNLAYEAVSAAFQHRLNAKSKQNYRLLQVLPSFLTIPRVRCLASRHLERWLQSPALAGLARNLLAHIVQELRCVEPPLTDDLEVINNILKLNLKANQLSMHIEHVTKIAKNMPNVAPLIFTHCLQGKCSTGTVSNAIKSNDEHLRMLRSVYAVLDRKVAANALASSVSSLATDVLNPGSSISDLNTQFQSISCLLCAVVDSLGKLYDGFHFVKAIIKSQSGMAKTMTSANITARLIYECALLVTRTIPSLQTSFGATARTAHKTSSSYDFDLVDEGDLNCFRSNMLGLRKTILKWCATDLCRVYYGKVIQEEQAKCSDTYYERGAVTRGPGAPDYNSVLTNANSPTKDANRSSPFNSMMTLIRCMLFLYPPSSKELESFAVAGENMEKDQFQRLDFCCQYGVDVDDEMLQIILSSSTFTPNTALSVIENLLLSCGRNKAAKISCNVETVWNMYKLAEYSPEFRSDFGNNSGLLSLNGNDLEVSAGKGSSTEQSGREMGERGLAKPKLPRLAVTSLWWRVSSIALVLSGLLPEQVGMAMWNEAPTLRALIRMTASQKYRFPTADCDETEKEIIRLAEEKVREKEGKIAELLFMPPKQNKPAKPKPQMLSPTHQRRGMRSSARQQQKIDKMLAVEQERQAAALHAENMKLRKVLRTLQKNVMLWNPKQDQRKPPKGSINLLLSVNDWFDLAEKFRLSKSPDFLLQTIGEGRSAIERSYDWLIPIISSHPAIIDRLQPSASCFLLLRAYGEEGDKNRELLDLTAPLLSHVSKCLTGDFSEHHALLAMDLLLQDIADESNDRRRCARKVLQEAVGSVDVLDSSQLQRDLGNCGWLFQMIRIKNCRKLVPLVIKYISLALAYERGKVLSIYISSLSEYKAFLKKLKVGDDGFDFVSTLCELIAVRPHVCFDAFDRYAPLRELAITEVKYSFERATLSSNGDAQRTLASSLVIINIPKDANDSTQNGNDSNVVVSSNLLHAAIILISNWKRRDNDENEQQSASEEDSILHLLKYLVIPFTPNGSGSDISGLSSAKYKHNEKRAVSVEEWVLLAKARAETVAKQAALSAPEIFLPRLLLCCGMQSSSFFTMLRRLDELGDSSADSGKTYKELISRSAVSEWGLPGVGSRSIIKRKLHGRILAYMRIHGKNSAEREIRKFDIAEKSSFVSWLSSENNSSDNMKKTRSMSQVYSGIAGNVKSFMPGSFDANDFEDLMDDDDGDDDGAENMGDMWSSVDQVEETIDGTLAPTEDLTLHFVGSCVASNQCDVLEGSLHLIAEKDIHNKEMDGATAAANNLLSLYKSFHTNSSYIRILVKWVPLLTQHYGEDHLWQLIFIEEIGRNEASSLVCECALKWSDEHIAACQAWIFEQTTCNPWKTVSSLDLVLRFLVVSSEQKSIHCLDYNDNARLHLPYQKSQECATSLTKLILYYISLASSGVIANGSQKGEKCLSSNRSIVLPDWLTLILMVGKSHQALVSRLISEKNDDTKSSPVLSSVLLRIYVMSPLKMNLSDSKLRNGLLQASNKHLPLWLDWRCPLDNQMSELLSNLTKSPHQRLVQSVTDIAKQHPLILIRQLYNINQKLLDDGSGRDSEQHSLVKRGRIFGRHPSGDAVAEIGGRTVKVSLVLWGYSFNEPVWTSVLDVLIALPVEVAFICGMKIGLADVLESYLRLFAVQKAELGSEDNIVRVREKFMKLIDSFRKCKSEAFEDWAQQDVPDWGNVRKLLSLVGIGP